MISIYLKEIKTFFNSIIGYIIIVLFLLGIGMTMWVFPPTVFDIEVADMSLLFDVAPFVFMFLIPAITMRQIAEEKKTGTIELLLTQPLSIKDIVLGKYLASLSLVLLALCPTVVFYVSIYLLGNPVGNIDVSAVLGSYVGLLLLAGVFNAIGLLCSSSTENQIIAFILGLFFCFVSFSWFGFIEGTFVSANAYYIKILGLGYHYDSLGRGVIDSRNVVYMLSWILFLLVATAQVVERNRK